jgi:hypothetical protein
MNLEGKTILITGATGTAGVGFGCVQAVIEAGGRPIINGRSARKSAEAQERFPQAEVAPGDVAKPAEVVKMFAGLADRGLVVDGLVNNAGIGLHKQPHECEEEDFDRLVGVDFRGTWLVTREWLKGVLGHLQRRPLEGVQHLAGKAEAENLAAAQVHRGQVVGGIGEPVAVPRGLTSSSRRKSLRLGSRPSAMPSRTIAMMRRRRWYWVRFCWVSRRINRLEAGDWRLEGEETEPIEQYSLRPTVSSLQPAKDIYPEAYEPGASPKSANHRGMGVPPNATSVVSQK